MAKNSDVCADKKNRIQSSPIKLTMHAEIKQLFSEYLELTEDKGAAASLVVASIMLRLQINLMNADTDLTVADAAKHLQCSDETIYRLCRSGKIPYSRIGVGRGVIRISMDDVLMALQSQNLNSLKEMDSITPRRNRRHLKLD